MVFFLVDARVNGFVLHQSALCGQLAYYLLDIKHALYSRLSEALLVCLELGLSY